MEDIKLMTKGFNAGYLLQKQDPELSEIIKTGFANKDMPFAKGYIAGVTEYLLEQMRENRIGRSDDLELGLDQEL